MCHQKITVADILLTGAHLPVQRDTPGCIIRRRSCLLQQLADLLAAVL